VSTFVTGRCRYLYNASEQYQMQTPGSGVESNCGATTYPIVDEPEIVPVTIRPPEGNPYVTFQKTGHLLPREKPDPYCPVHGGTQPVEQTTITFAEVIAAQKNLAQLAEQYQTATGLPLPDFSAITQGVTASG
jgi:hypothetical protein